MAEKEYIERNELISNLKTFAPEYYSDLINDLITKQPAADVEPVRHGQWVVDDADSGDGTYAAYIEVHCSECGFDAGLETGQYGWGYGDEFPYKYCPGCGAKMDGGLK